MLLCPLQSVEAKDMSILRPCDCHLSPANGAWPAMLYSQPECWYIIHIHNIIMLNTAYRSTCHLHNICVTSGYTLLQAFAPDNAGWIDRQSFVWGLQYYSCNNTYSHQSSMWLWHQLGIFSWELWILPPWYPRLLGLIWPMLWAALKL